MPCENEFALGSTESINVGYDISFCSQFTVSLLHLGRPFVIRIPLSCPQSWGVRYVSEENLSLDTNLPRFSGAKRKWDKHFPTLLIATTRVMTNIKYYFVTLLQPEPEKVMMTRLLTEKNIIKWCTDMMSFKGLTALGIRPKQECRLFLSALHCNTR